MLDSTMDQLFQGIRTRKIISKLNKGESILDIGCNVNLLFFSEVGKYFKNYVGLDIRLKKYDSFNFVKYFVEDSIPFKDESFDTVSMMAVFEHLRYKDAVLSEVFRVLKKSGKLIMTVPSPKAEFIIRLFALFGLISKELADEHKFLMNKNQIKELLIKIGFKDVEISKFELGFNYLISAEK